MGGAASWRARSPPASAKGQVQAQRKSDAVDEPEATGGPEEARGGEGWGYARFQIRGGTAVSRPALASQQLLPLRGPGRVPSGPQHQSQGAETRWPLEPQPPLLLCPQLVLPWAGPSIHGRPSRRTSVLLTWNFPQSGRPSSGPAYPLMITPPPRLQAPSGSCSSFLHP